MVSRAIAAAQIPAISDNIGRKAVLIVSLLIYSISTVLLGFARDFSTLFFLRIIEGAAAGAAFPTAEALLVDSVPQKDRGAWMGKYFTTFNLGFVIGPGMGGVLYIFGQEFLGLNSLEAFAFPFVITGLLGLSSFIAVIFFVSDVLPTTRHDHSETKNPKKPLSKEPTPFYASFLAIALINGFAIGLIIPVFALYVENSFSLDVAMIGFIFTISGGVSLLVNYPAGKLSDKVERMYIVFAGMVLGTFAFLGVGLATSLLIVLLFFILRFVAIQAYFPAYRAFQADKIPPARRGEQMGRIQSAFNAGAVVGPLIGAWIYEIFEAEAMRLPGGYEFYGGGVPFLVSAGVSFIQLAIAFYILKAERARKGIQPKEIVRFPTVKEVLSSYCSACGTPGFLGSYETCEKCGAPINNSEAESMALS